MSKILEFKSKTNYELLHKTEVWQWRLTPTCLTQIRVHGQLSKEAIEKFILLLKLQNECFPTQAEIDQLLAGEPNNENTELQNVRL